MAYTPPNAFVAGTTLTAADLEGNLDALRVYLHSGIAIGDFAGTQWIDTRHIQPPRYEPFTAVQHGVSGHQGAQWSGGQVVSLTFLTKYLTGQGAQGPLSWHQVPNTSFSVQLRRPARCIFHYHFEVEVGPDNSPNGDQVAGIDRLIWVSPYLATTSATSHFDMQEGGSAQDYWLASAAGEPTSTPIEPYPITGGYAQRAGVRVEDMTSPGTFEMGLGCYSRVDRAAVVNWSVAIETYYL